MEFKAVIFRDDVDKNVHMFLLDEKFKSLGLPSLCVSEGVYENNLTTKNFYICKVDFIPNRRFDGKFEILQDFDKFDYMISGDICFEVKNEKIEDFTVHQMLREGNFWRFVDYLVEKENLKDRLNDEDDQIGETITKTKEVENEI